jgi:catalase
MIEMFIQCDKDYGRRVADGLKMAKNNGEAKKDDAVKQAEKMGHPSDPY